MKKSIVTSVTIASLFLLVVSPVFAHVTVTPSSVGIGSFQTFVTGVPVEKEVPTVALRLVIPEGMDYVTPNVKPGWTITTKKTGEGESAKVTEIAWTNGSIPAGQRDEFAFSAKTPSTAGELHWKAYQTYKDGTVVSWDQEPGKPLSDEVEITPYSVTKVVDDLSAPAPQKQEEALSKKTQVLATTAFVISLAALGISVSRRSSIK